MTTAKITTAKIADRRGNLQEVFADGVSIGFLFKSKTGGAVAATPWQTFAPRTSTEAERAHGADDVVVGDIFGEAFYSAKAAALCTTPLTVGTKADAVAQVAASSPVAAA